MRALLIVLSVALTSLVSGPVQAQTAADDQYGSSGVGHDAATDALRASSVFGDAPATEAAAVEEGTVSAAGITSSSVPEGASVEESAGAEAADSEVGAVSEKSPEIDALPDTGGASPLLLGVLLVASGVLVRALTR